MLTFAVCKPRQFSVTMSWVEKHTTSFLYSALHSSSDLNFKEFSIISQNLALIKKIHPNFNMVAWTESCDTEYWEEYTWEYKVDDMVKSRQCILNWLQGNCYYICRWFNFTLKPPNSMVIEIFFSAIWDTSHWNFFWSNLDSRHLMTSPRTLFGQFWHMSIFVDSRAIWVIYQIWVPSENQFFLDEGATSLP